jgi:hypothetical protein
VNASEYFRRILQFEIRVIQVNVDSVFAVMDILVGGSRYGRSLLHLFDLDFALFYRLNLGLLSGLLDFKLGPKRLYLSLKISLVSGLLIFALTPKLLNLSLVPFVLLLQQLKNVAEGLARLNLSVGL